MRADRQTAPCYTVPMRRWPTILLCLVLFAAAMLVVRAVLVVGLHATVPTLDAWLDDTLGHTTHLVALAVLLGGCAIFGFWPRDAQGRMKPLSRR